MTGAVPPATLVIFGAFGDLASRLLLPSLLHLSRDKLIGDDFRLLGIGKRDGDDDALRSHLEEHLPDGDEAAAGWRSLRDRVSYLQGDFGDDAVFTALGERLKGNVAFYLATAPSFFGSIVDRLGDAGLLGEDDGFRRIAIEKPFGHDLASAQALNAQILARVSEAQIYRVDHFLGKETVQSILVARFGNALLEPVWNMRHIDHVQITVAETVAVGTRGKFYDETGALRDMIPNHLFQLMATIAMEPPNSLDAEAIRNEKARLLAAIRPVKPDEAVRGRYAAGKAGDADVVDYRTEKDVAADSRTETYAALKVHVDTARWDGTPFYLRTGKALAARDSEIVIQFRPAPGFLFREAGGDCPPNRLIFQIQPKEGMELGLLVKQPGPEVAIADIRLAFCYQDAFELGHRTGYEALIHDLLTGDQTLFQRADMIEAGWAAVQPVLDAWSKGEPEDYPAGSAGPRSADDLLDRDGRAWHDLG